MHPGKNGGDCLPERALELRLVRASDPVAAGFALAFGNRYFAAAMRLE
jgi:hypothetical protein